MHITPDLRSHLPQIILSSSGKRCRCLACVHPSFTPLLLLGQLFTDSLVLQCLSLLDEDSISFFAC